MKIIQTLKDRFRKVIANYIPVQKNIISIGSKSIINNSVISIPFKDVKKMTYSSFRKYFNKTEHIFTGNSTVTLKINSPAQPDILLLQFFDAEGNKVIPYDVEFYSGASGATYPLVSIAYGDDGPTIRLLYSSTTRGSNEFADIYEVDGIHSVIFKKNT